jgi:hypothetical protein
MARASLGGEGLRFGLVTIAADITLAPFASVRRVPPGAVHNGGR